MSETIKQAVARARGDVFVLLAAGYAEAGSSLRLKVSKPEAKRIIDGERYYPSGGVDDLVGSYETLEEAVTVAKATKCDWWHITDSSLEVVESGWN